VVLNFSTSRGTISFSKDSALWSKVVSVQNFKTLLGHGEYIANKQRVRVELLMFAFLLHIGPANLVFLMSHLGMLPYNSTIKCNVAHELASLCVDDHTS
jgi:hypothetical protein